jgi:DNA polymerase-3 subunit delta
VPSDDLLVPLTLVVGDEELLVARAVTDVVHAARSIDPDADVRDLVCGDLQRGDLDEVLTPSLFGDRRVVVLRSAQDLLKEVTPELTSYVGDPLPEVSLVVVHAGGQKGKALLTSLAGAKPRRVDVPKLNKYGDRRDFARRELRADGRTVEEEALGLLLESVGTDLRELASAAGQLLADTSGPVTVEIVQRYHRGRADSSGFTVADRAVDGDLAGALELARWGASTGLAPVLVTSALASTLRSMAMVASSAGVPAGQLATQLGMPSWKVDKCRRQVRGWRPEGLSAAVQAVARADADVKGAAADPAYAVERTLLQVVQARGAVR